MNLIEATDLRKTYRLSRRTSIDALQGVDVSIAAGGRALHDHAGLEASRGTPPAMPEGRRLRRRHLWLIPGLAIAFYASAQAGAHGLGLGVLLLFTIVPHLPVLLGVGQPHARGQMATRAVPLFNALHHPVPPLVVLGLAALGVLSPFWLVGAIAWFSHIVIDLGLGHGLRTSDGWRRAWWTPR